MHEVETLRVVKLTGIPGLVSLARPSHSAVFSPERTKRCGV